MTVDREYCMSAFLTYRTIHNPEFTFADWLLPRHFDLPSIEERLPVRDSETLKNELRRATQEAAKDGKAALALSGGIDSAILAKFMPRGSVAYTFRCVVPGIQVTDESATAARYAEECGLEHRIIDISWEDVQRLSPALMKRRGAPIHSIEVQICKAAMQAKADGFERLIFGESADANYGGHDGLLSKDWLAGDFIERYTYVSRGKRSSTRAWRWMATSPSFATGTSTRIPLPLPFIFAKVPPAISTPVIWPAATQFFPFWALTWMRPSITHACAPARANTWCGRCFAPCTQTSSPRPSCPCPAPPTNGLRTGRVPFARNFCPTAPTT